MVLILLQAVVHRNVQEEIVSTQLCDSADDNLYDSCTNEKTGQCKPNPPTGTFTADPRLVRSGDRTLVTWVISDVSACTIQGGGKTWRNASAGCNGTACESSGTSNPITSQTTFTLSCTGLDGSTFTRSATVTMAPRYKEY